MVWYRETDCSVLEFGGLVETVVDPGRLEFTGVVDRNVPIYDGAALGGALRDAAARPRLLAEWAAVMLDGPGVLVLRGAYPDPSPIDEATAIFESIVAHERESGTSAGDHFAKPGANSRIWNALEKLCVRSPDVFIRYYANPF